MNLLLAFLSALAYGVSDFAGGFASRQHSALDVILLSYPVSALAVLLVCPLFGGALTMHTTLLGIGSGMTMAVAIWWFYAALARGPMSVVSPVTAVLVAGLPVMAGLSIGESLSQTAAGGIVLAILAVLLVSRQTPADPSLGGTAQLPFTRSVLALTLGAGTAFAFSFMLAHQIPPGAGLWPIFLARLSATFFVLLASRATVAMLAWPDRKLLIYALTIGLLDAVANATMYFALQGSQLSTTSVVISLYPVFTVLLAVLVVKETVNRLQWAGMFLALLSIAAISYAP